MRNKRKPRVSNTSPAFTSLELLACIAASALLLSVVLPVVSASRSRSDRVACLSNLRQIGNAFRQFGLEHNDIMPWSQLAGPEGNFSEPGKHELWFQYWWLRDAIGTPKILMDPAETRAAARTATSWNLGPSTGLPNLKNNGVAYVLGIDSSTDLPRSLLVADRNILDSGYTGGPLSTTVRVSASTTRWLDEVHGIVGNIAFADGSVDSADTEGLRRAIAASRVEDGYARVMTASWGE